MTSSTIDEKGRITIPSALRKKFNLEQGTKIHFLIINDLLIIRKAIDAEVFDEISNKIAEQVLEKTDSPIELQKLF